MSQSPIAVIVLDRDGTVIEDRHYIKKEEDVIFFPGAFQALRTLQEKGYPLFLVSNQSGVGRGWIQDDEFRSVHRRFLAGLKAEGLEFDEIAFCFHAPEEDCPCRKPKTGLLPTHFRGRPIDWARSYVVGDHVPDVGLAQAIGAVPCLVLTGKGKETQNTPLPARTQVFANIADFAASISSVNA